MMVDLAGLARAIAIAAAVWLAIGAAVVLVPVVSELVTIR